MTKKLIERKKQPHDCWVRLTPLSVKETRLTEVEYMDEEAWKRAGNQLWKRLQELARSGKLKELNLTI